MDEANALSDMEIDEIALCRQGAHAGAKMVLQKSVRRDNNPVPAPDVLKAEQVVVRSRFTLAALQARSARK